MIKLDKDSLASLLVVEGRLSIGRVLLWLFTLLLLGWGYYIAVDKRVEVFTSLHSSPTALSLAVGGIFLSVIGWAFVAQVSRLDKRTEAAQRKAEEFEAYLRSQVVDLSARLTIREAESLTLRGEHSECKSSLAATAAALADVRARLNKAERILRDNGLEIDETKP